MVPAQEGVSKDGGMAMVAGWQQQLVWGWVGMVVVVMMVKAAAVGRQRAGSGDGDSNRDGNGVAVVVGRGWEGEGMGMVMAVGCNLGIAMAMGWQGDADGVGQGDRNEDSNEDRDVSRFSISSSHPHPLHRVVTDECYPFTSQESQPAAQPCMMHSRSTGRGKRQATARCPNPQSHGNEIYQSTPAYRLAPSVSSRGAGGGSACKSQAGDQSGAEREGRDAMPGLDVELPLQVAEEGWCHLAGCPWGAVGQKVGTPALGIGCFCACRRRKS